MIFEGPDAVKRGLLANSRPLEPRNTCRSPDPPVKVSNSRGNLRGHTTYKREHATNTLLP